MLAALWSDMQGDVGPVLQLNDQNAIMRLPRRSDFESWQRVRLESADTIRPWEPTWLEDAHSRSRFLAFVRNSRREFLADAGASLLIVDEKTADVLGGLNLRHLRRSATQSINIGYWMGSRHTRRGLMTAAVKASVDFAFNQLNLHRVEAACQPDNWASLRVLEKAGFEREGFARSFLRIDGEWCDHVLLARIREYRS